MYHSSSYSTVETFIWSKENVFWKTEIFFVLFFKNSRTQLAAFVIWKNKCVVLHTPKHWNIFFWSYSGVCCLAVWYTFLSFCKLLLQTDCLFRCFSLTKFCLNVISFNFCVTLLLHQHILKAIWKFRYWHLSISIDTAKFYFSLRRIFWKRKHVLICTSVTLLQLLIDLWSSFHPSRGNDWCCRKKVVWVFEVLIH